MYINTMETVLSQLQNRGKRVYLKFYRQVTYIYIHKFLLGKPRHFEGGGVFIQMAIKTCSIVAMIYLVARTYEPVDVV